MPGIFQLIKISTQKVSSQPFKSTRADCHRYPEHNKNYVPGSEKELRRLSQQSAQLIRNTPQTEQKRQLIHCEKVAFFVSISILPKIRFISIGTETMSDQALTRLP